MTLGCWVKSDVAFTIPVTLTIRLTLFRSPSSAFSAANCAMPRESRRIVSIFNGEVSAEFTGHIGAVPLFSDLCLLKRGGYRLGQH